MNWEMLISDPELKYYRYWQETCPQLFSGILELQE